jgi:hypothetical protein
MVIWGGLQPKREIRHAASGSWLLGPSQCYQGSIGTLCFAVCGCGLFPYSLHLSCQSYHMPPSDFKLLNTGLHTIISALNNSYQGTDGTTERCLIYPPYTIPSCTCSPILAFRIPSLTPQKTSFLTAWRSRASGKFWVGLHMEGLFPLLQRACMTAVAFSIVHATGLE